MARKLSIPQVKIPDHTELLLLFAGSARASAINISTACNGNAPVTNGGNPPASRLVVTRLNQAGNANLVRANPDSSIAGPNSFYNAIVMNYNTAAAYAEGTEQANNATAVVTTNPTWSVGITQVMTSLTLDETSQFSDPNDNKDHISTPRRRSP